MLDPSMSLTRAPGWASGSLQGRNPREVGRSGAVGSMGIAALVGLGGATRIAVSAEQAPSPEPQIMPAESCPLPSVWLSYERSWETMKTASKEPLWCGLP